MKICSTKSIGVGGKGDFLTYCFEEAKLLELLVKKNNRIIKHLADNYARNTSASEAKIENATGGIIKQEKKN